MNDVEASIEGCIKKTRQSEQMTSPIFFLISVNQNVKLRLHQNYAFCLNILNQNIPFGQKVFIDLLWKTCSYLTIRFLRVPGSKASVIKRGKVSQV